MGAWKMHPCANCLVIFSAVFIIIASSLNLCQGILFEFVSFQHGTCTLDPQFTCKEETIRVRGKRESYKRWAAMFKEAQFTSASIANRSTISGTVAKTCSVNNIATDSWSPTDFLRLIRGMPSGWSSTSQSLAECQSAAASLIGVSRSCYLIDGDLCDVDPSLSLDELRKRNNVKLWSIIPLPVFPMFMLIAWCFLDHCLGCCGGCPREHVSENSKTYVPMKLTTVEAEDGAEAGPTPLAVEESDDLLIREGTGLPRNTGLLGLMCGCNRQTQRGIP